MTANNEKTTLDYRAFLADLEAKKAVLDQAIASVRAVIASGAQAISVGDSLPLMTDSAAIGVHGGEVPVGAFLGKSIPDAAKLCLQIVKRKMTTREVADALLKGGIETTSKKFSTILHTILTRATRAGNGIVKLDKHWGLSDWYPAGLRSGAQTQEKRKAPSKKRRKNREERASKPESKTQVPATVQTGTKPKDRIVQVLRNQPGMELSLEELAKYLGMHVRVTGMVLGKMIKQNHVQKTTTGKYRLAA